MKMSPKRLVVLGAVVGAVAAIAVPVALAVTAVGTLTHTDSALGHTRLFRDGVPSTCHGKASPGNFDSFNDRRVYDKYRFKNSATTSKCAHVYIVQTCGTSLHGQANSTFVATNPSANFLGDAGSSLEEQSFSFPVAAGQSFDVVLGQVFAGNLNCAYALDVTVGGAKQQPTATATKVGATDL